MWIYIAHRRGTSNAIMTSQTTSTSTLQEQIMLYVTSAIYNSHDRRLVDLTVSSTVAQNSSI